MFSHYFTAVLCYEEHQAFTALSSQHTLPQDLGSGQVSLLSFCVLLLGCGQMVSLKKNLGRCVIGKIVCHQKLLFLSNLILQQSPAQKNQELETVDPPKYCTPNIG